MRLLAGGLICAVALAQIDYNQQIARRPSITVTSGPYFAKGTGAAVNDNAAFQSAINAICANGGVLEVPTPIAYYGMVAGIQIISCQNITIHCASGATIKFQPGTVDTVYNTWPNYGLASILRIVDSKNITVQNCALDGNLPNRTAHVGGESFNSDILVAGSTNIHIQNSVIQNGMTDGVTVVPDGVPTTNTNVWIESNQILNSRRNNISATGQTGLFIKGNSLSGAGSIQGTNPKSNIDVEPDNVAVLSKNVHVEGNNITTAAGTFSCTFAGFGTVGLTVANNQVHDDAVSGCNFDSVDTSHLNVNAVFSGNTVYNETAGSGLRVNLQSLDVASGNTFRNNLGAIALFSPKGLLITGNLFDSNLNQAISDGGMGFGFLALNISGNIFKDNFSATGVSNMASGAAYTGTPDSSSALLTFDSNTIYGTAAPSATSPAGLVLSSVICKCYGRGNQGLNLNATTNGGFLSRTPGVESDVVPFVQVNATPGTAIASASSITITAPYQHVSGTAAIQNIVIPPGFASVSGGAAGCVTLIPDGAWTTITGGTAGTQIYNAITATLNVPVMACYDAGTGGWYMK